MRLFQAGKKESINEMLMRMSNDPDVKDVAASIEQRANEPIHFECTRLKDVREQGKKGIILPDEDGCYTMCIGGLNVYNHSGAFYTLEEARDIFENESSSFRRRLKKGVLKAELDHPRFEFKPGMSREQQQAEYINRLYDIHSDRVCAQFYDIWLEHDLLKGENGQPIVAIMGKFKPAGVFGEQLRRDLETPGNQVCFSIRSFTEDKYIGGKLVKTLREVITFDQVNEPGIWNAEKLLSPTLESLQEITLTKGDLLLATMQQLEYSTGVSLESATQRKHDLLNTFFKEKKQEQISLESVAQPANTRIKHRGSPVFGIRR